jgi:hypothetical protein
LNIERGFTQGDQQARLADVACLTETAWARNRSRAARGMHEPIEATVRWLAAATAPDGRAVFQEMRDEATAMLAAARASYLRARGVTASAR